MDVMRANSSTLVNELRDEGEEGVIAELQNLENGVYLAGLAQRTNHSDEVGVIPEVQNLEAIQTSPISPANPVSTANATETTSPTNSANSASVANATGTASPATSANPASMANTTGTTSTVAATNPTTTTSNISQNISPTISPVSSIAEAPSVPLVITAPEVAPEPEENIPIRTRPAPPVASYRVPTTIPPGGVAYTIRWGDTLWDISEAFYRNPWLYTRIARFNNIGNPDIIISGRIIRIPPRQ
jgi:nucleoid-associated protein YgaU